MSNGARAVYANNEFFAPLKNILKDNDAINMGDGWETRRRREPDSSNNDLIGGL